MRTRRSGSSVLIFLLLFALAAVAGGKRKVAPGPYAIVGGTVFHEPGLALPGAQVTLTPDPEPGQEPSPIKKFTAGTDSRGEFAFRVPTSAMRYQVRAASKGYAPQQKSVSVEGEQRVDVTFNLSTESK